jgi:chromatin remodeling complex protein RSC6
MMVRFPFFLAIKKKNRNRLESLDSLNPIVVEKEKSRGVKVMSVNQQENDDIFGDSGDEGKVTTSESIKSTADGTQEDQETKQKTAIKERLLIILEQSDISEISLKELRQQLENYFHEPAQKTNFPTLDVSAYKAFIKQIVEEYVNSQNDEEDNNEEDDNESEEETSSRRKTRNASNKKKMSQKDVKDEDNPESRGTKRKSVFSKPVLLSPALEEFMGKKFAPRHEVVKFFWAYIKEHNLQNPKDKRVILFDERLQKMFKAKTAHFTKLTKLIFAVGITSLHSILFVIAHFDLL